MSGPASLTACAAAEAMQRRELSSEELVMACLERIAAREEQVRAWAWIDPDHALGEARAADQARRSGRGVGPLCGLPVGIKDIIETADMPTENGSPICKGRQTLRDAHSVAALRAAGAVVMGKTVTTEYATLTPSKTRNPRNLAHTPGGSSAGSAAAVADGMIPLALATQTGGSVIRPASFNGIYGLKPTLGLISRRGVTLQSHTLDTVGVYGRSVDDLALIADALSGHDPDDPVSYQRSRPRLLERAREPAPLPPLFAFVRTPEWERSGEAVMREAMGELVAELGAAVEEVDLAVLEDVIAAQKVVQAAENGHHLGPLLVRHRELLSEGLRERLEAGRRIPAHAYLGAVAVRERAYAAVEDLLASYTAILTPAAPGPAPRGFATTGNPIFNGLWTFLGVPAVTLPLLEADGLPIGVQLVGARQDEGRLLRTARWLDERVRAAA
jgi:Asp-tRNA(Asn)/Glu-tRNA(Gln) amidotransferase A subunit family amidase